MTYFDPDEGAALRDAFEDLVGEWNAVTSKTMFGCPSYLADGTLFAVLVTDAVALTRLPADRRAELDDAFETGPFTAGERTVTKWTNVSITDPSDLVRLAPFVEASYQTALAE